MTKSWNLPYIEGMSLRRGVSSSLLGGVWGGLIVVRSRIRCPSTLLNSTFGTRFVGKPGGGGSAMYF